MDDWLIDLSATPAKLQTNDPKRIIYVHGGCKNVVDNEFDNILSHLQQLGPKAKSVCFTGHSLGAALAQIFAATYAFLPRDQQPLPLRAKIYTFACPMVLWTEHVDNNIDLVDSAFQCVNFVNENDVFPRLLSCSTPAISRIVLRKLSTRNGFVQGIADMVGPLIEGKMREFKIITSFSPLAQISELLVPAERTSQSYSRVSSQQSPCTIIGKSIMDMNIDDHSAVRYVNNLSICGKFNAATKKWVSQKHSSGSSYCNNGDWYCAVHMSWRPDLHNKGQKWLCFLIFSVF